MSTLKLSKPTNTSVQNIAMHESIVEIIFTFDISNAFIEKVGNNLAITDDGTSLILEGFYSVYSADFIPTFVIDDEKILGEDFFTTLAPTLMPAAGHESGILQETNNQIENESDPLSGGVNPLEGVAGGSNYSNKPTFFESSAEPEESIAENSNNQNTSTKTEFNLNNNTNMIVDNDGSDIIYLTENDDTIIFDLDETADGVTLINDTVHNFDAENDLLDLTELSKAGYTISTANQEGNGIITISDADGNAQQTITVTGFEFAENELGENLQNLSDDSFLKI